MCNSQQRDLSLACVGALVCNTSPLLLGRNKFLLDSLLLSLHTGWEITRCPDTFLLHSCLESNLSLQLLCFSFLQVWALMPVPAPVAGVGGLLATVSVCVGTGSLLKHRFQDRRSQVKLCFSLNELS